MVGKECPKSSGIQLSLPPPPFAEKTDVLLRRGVAEESEHRTGGSSASDVLLLPLSTAAEFHGESNGDGDDLSLTRICVAGPRRDQPLLRRRRRVSADDSN